MAKLAKRKLLSSLAVTFAIVILLTYCLKDVTGIHTVEVEDNKVEDNTLPFILERLLESHSDEVSAFELDKIRTKWAEQERLNQEVIKAKGGAVLDFSPLDGGTSSCLASVEVTSPYEPYGYIQNAEAMIGYIDYNHAHLHTEGWNENPYDPMGGEAFAAGYMTQYAGGDVYIYAKKGPHTGSNPPWKNIVMIFASNDINTPVLQWDYIGLAEVHIGVTAYHYIGTTDNTYSCFSIMCWTPPPYPIPYPYPDYFNCVNIDMVYATRSEGCSLEISSGVGGTTNPSPGWYWNEFGTQVQVTAVENANYDFDHWTLDGEYCTENPINVTMSRSTHFLKANFISTGPTHQLTVLACDQYDRYGYVPLYIDDQYVGTTGYTYTVTEGNRQIYVQSPLYGYDQGHYYEATFQYYYYDSTYNSNNPMTLPVTADKTVTVHYHIQMIR